MLELYSRLKIKILITFEFLRLKHRPENIWVGGSIKLTKYTHLGENIHLKGIKITGKGEVVIHDNVKIERDCLIISSIHNYDFGDAIPYDHSSIDKGVTIEKDVLIGEKVTILGGVTIGQGAIVLPGSCVVKSIPAYSVAGGHPAAVMAITSRS